MRTVSLWVKSSTFSACIAVGNLPLSFASSVSWCLLVNHTLQPGAKIPREIAKRQMSDWSSLCCSWVQLQGHDTYLVNTINLSVQRFVIHEKQLRSNLPTWLRNKVWENLSPYSLHYAFDLGWNSLTSSCSTHKLTTKASVPAVYSQGANVWVISQFPLFPERYCRPEFTVWLPVSAAMPFLLL